MQYQTNFLIELKVFMVNEEKGTFELIFSLFIIWTIVKSKKKKKINNDLVIMYAVWKLIQFNS